MNSLENIRGLPTQPKRQKDYILLDASSSMSPRWWDSLQAIDDYVGGLKIASVNSDVTVATFTTSTFDRISFDKCRQSTVDEWQSVVEGEAVPFYAGSTPLYDAINIMVKELRDLNPPKVSIVIVTDGEENISKTTAAQAKGLIDWCRAKGWQVTFLGCDFDNNKQAKLLGVGPANAIGTSAKRLKDATAELAKKRAHHAHFGTPMNFSEDEQHKFGGYLTSGN
jgi:hypothetical protein